MNERHARPRAATTNPLEARIQSLEMAFRMQSEAQDAFDIGRETAATRELYGDGEFANACLIARRLVERGRADDARSTTATASRGTTTPTSSTTATTPSKSDQRDRRAC